MNTRCVLLLAILTTIAGQGAAGGTPPSQVVQSGRIEGTVLLSGTSQPVAGAAITLAPTATAAQTTAFNNGRAPELRLAHDGVTLLQEDFGWKPGEPYRPAALTDNAGRFSIENLPPGSYAVSAYREGYFGRGSDPETPSIYDGAAMHDMLMITVVRGESAKATMELIPGASITGLVTDEQGSPMVGKDVHALRAHRQGNVTALQGVTSTVTDDRGHYRLHTLPPGEYFISGGLEFPKGDDPVKAVIDPEKKQPVLTFHPAATNPAAASSIALRGGENLQGKDIVVQHAALVKISGRVLNDSTIRNATYALVKLSWPSTWTLDFKGVFGGLWASATATANFTQPDRGEFEIRGAFAPGSYELRATVESAGGRNRQRAVGSTLFTLGSGDLDGIALVVKNPN